jgi:hypothetical protein
MSLQPSFVPSRLSGSGIRQAANSKTACRFGMNLMSASVPAFQWRVQAHNEEFTPLFLPFLCRRFCIRSLSGPSPTNSYRSEPRMN